MLLRSRWRGYFLSEEEAAAAAGAGVAAGVVAGFEAVRGVLAGVLLSPEDLGLALP